MQVGSVPATLALFLMPAPSPWGPSFADWDARLTSTYPDTLAQAANKSALTALGCYDISKPHVPTQVAVPMMCLDDSTGAGAPRLKGLQGLLCV